MEPIIIICGPTASGKSAHALDIAQSSDGVIINADAMQVYRELRILTARPCEEVEAIVPHRLYGVVPAHEKCSVAKWLELAKAAIDETLAAGKRPVITGGTGLYIKALMEGLSPIPDIPKEAHEQAVLLWEEQGAEALTRYDAVMSERLKPGDMQRHIRSLEVILATGKSLAYWQGIACVKPYPQATFDIRYIDVPREEIYQRCNIRFMNMMKSGALEEAKTLHAMRLSDDMPILRAVGVQEIFAFLEGKSNLDEAIKHAQQATRNYAKRQLTWFRNQLIGLNVTSIALAEGMLVKKS